jgi:DNA-binding SARP family transcriptional activator
MARTIRLLGRPSIEIDGRPVRGPRGRKSWAILAFLILAERPPSRQRVAALLFDTADDPLGALRWSLAEIRRALGDKDIVNGDPLELRLPEGTVVDIDALTHAADSQGRAADPFGELLEGMSFPGCDAFESWLLVERRRQGAAVEAFLREAGLAKLASGHPREAARIGSNLVALNPLDEGHHVLLVRSLAAAGERRAAAQAAAATADLFRRELGTSPSPAVRDAAEVSAGSLSSRALTGAAAARAQLGAGSAAIAAGAVDAGLDCLRRAVDEARYADDDELLVSALMALGGALVHAVRGRDEEGASVLHEAIERATADQSAMTATACRELGFVDVQAGRRERAALWLERAHTLAEASGDDGELASIAGVRGMSLSDQARYPEALEMLHDSVGRALHSGSRKQAAWSASHIGRLHVLRAEYDEAEVALQQSTALAKSERWVAFLPWPEAFSAELDLIEGRRAQADRRLREAFALACQLGDPCWEGVSGRGIGVLESRDEPALAMTKLLDARDRCVRWPDAYQWLQGYILDAICTVAADVDKGAALQSADQLLTLASRMDMRELVSRAQVHRSRLGASGAAVAAQLAATGIDNPALQQLVSAAGPSGA